MPKYQRLILAALSIWFQSKSPVKRMATLKETKLLAAPGWPSGVARWDQCDQIGRFIGLWATFQFLGNFCKGFKILNFLEKLFLGNFCRHLAIFFWSHWLRWNPFYVDRSNLRRLNSPNFNPFCYLKMDQPTPLFHLFLVFSNNTIQFFATNQCEKCLTVHPYGAGIQIHNLMHMSRHPWPLDQGYHYFCYFVIQKIRPTQEPMSKTNFRKALCYTTLK